jgi:uncharacterized membrane protein YfcA
VASTLVGSGHAPRTSVGSVNVSEFFVTTAAATTFFIELGMVSIGQLVALIVGGLIAAPFGGWVVKHVQVYVLMALVGCLVIALALWQFARVFGLR